MSRHRVAHIPAPTQYPNLIRLRKSGDVIISNGFYYYIGKSGYKTVLGPIGREEYSERLLREWMV